MRPLLNPNSRQLTMRNEQLDSRSPLTQLRGLLSVPHPLLTRLPSRTVLRREELREQLDPRLQSVSRSHDCEGISDHRRVLDGINLSWHGMAGHGNCTVKSCSPQTTAKKNVKPSVSGSRHCSYDERSHHGAPRWELGGCCSFQNYKMMQRWIETREQSLLVIARVNSVNIQYEYCVRQERNIDLTVVIGSVR